jgi:hypothetical protein
MVILPWQSRRARLLFTVQVVVNLGSGNQNSPKAAKLPKHFAPHKSADCFFANAQSSSGAFHIEGLAFGCWWRAHVEALHYTTDRDFFGAGYTQIHALAAARNSYVNRSASGGTWAVILLCCRGAIKTGIML